MSDEGGPIRVTQAAGGVLRRAADERLALIRPRRFADQWSLPKGKLDPGETLEQAALREVLEETGCEARIVAFIGATAYRVEPRRPKIAAFYEMRLVRDRGFQPNGEIEEVAWVEPVEAANRLRHESERRLLREFFRLD